MDAGKNQPANRPPKPRCLPKDAAKLWDVVVDYLVGRGVVDTIDATELEMMCRLWGLTRAALAAAEKDPVSKNARVAATAYATRFEAVASRFGMSPIDRARIQMQSTVEVETDNKAKFFRSTG
jgi:phage terminase small subunit